MSSTPQFGLDGCRLHYWFQGAPEDRIGGPWSYQVFHDRPGASASRQRQEWLRVLKPFLHRAMTSEPSDPDPTRLPSRTSARKLMNSSNAW